MRYYHMIIARPAAENIGDTSTRREYIARRQGSAPEGWVCVGVCGFHDEPGKGERRPNKMTPRKAEAMREKVLRSACQVYENEVYQYWIDANGHLCRAMLDDLDTLGMYENEAVEVLD